MYNKIYITIVLLVSTLFMAADCERQNICTKKYSFDFPISLSPARDIYQIGDTIWISIEYDNNDLLDLNTSENISANDFEFFFEMLLEKFDSLNTEDGFEKFTYLANEGGITIRPLENFKLLECRC